MYSITSVLKISFFVHVKHHIRLYLSFLSLTIIAIIFHLRKFNVLLLYFLVAGPLLAATELLWCRFDTLV